MTFFWFDEPASPDTVGGKGYHLSEMTRAGLPVPFGFSIPVGAMNSLRAAELESALVRLGAKSVAVRSSAVGEDAGNTSFAGIHATRLNVRTSEQVWDAVQEIHISGFAPSALAYRRKLGITTTPAMAAIVQTQIAAEAAGVLFMRDPVSGVDQIVIEGCWGLGEAVVAGIVTPDRWILARNGTLIRSDISNKDAAIIQGADGTLQINVAESQRRRPCMEQESIAELVRLARACGDLFGSPQDLEWAIASGKVWLLQSRSITGGHSG